VLFEAVIFDLDGTLVDSERDGHLVAFNQAFAEAGLPFRWSAEEYGRLLQIAGGRQRLAHYLRQQGIEAAAAEPLADRLHARKTELFRPKLRLRIVGFCPVYRSFARLGAVWFVAT